MASRIEEIEAIINSLIESAEGEPLSGTTPLKYAEVLDVSIKPTVYPCSTLLFSYPEQIVLSLGDDPITDNTWRWVQSSYFDATGDALLAEAQREMKRLLPALMTAFRHVDPGDLILSDGMQIILDIEDAGDPNIGPIDDSTRVLVKALNLIARTEEL